MIFPTTNDLTEGKYNRYEVALAAARCARLVTNEYVRQRNEAESSLTGNKETDRPLNTMIDRDLRDEKAVKIAINRLYDHTYVITRKSVEEQEKAERAVLENSPDEEPVLLPDDEQEAADGDILQDMPDEMAEPAESAEQGSLDEAVEPNSLDEQGGQEPETEDAGDADADVNADTTADSTADSRADSSADSSDNADSGESADGDAE